MINISAKTYVKDVATLAAKIDASKYTGIYGIPRGGVPVALELSKHLNLPVVGEPTKGTLIADDLIDSGRTLAAYPNNDTAVIYRKKNSPKNETYYAREVDGWIVFFYDKADYDLEDNVIRILQYFGQNAASDNLRETPAKYLGLLKNFLATEELNLITTKNQDLNGKQVEYSGIEFISLCEQHLMPFVGTVSVVITQNNRTISADELKRAVRWCSRNLQSQQRLTDQIAHLLNEKLMPKNVTVTVSARHLCAEMTGEPVQNITTVATKNTSV